MAPRSERSSAASANCAFGESTCLARVPPQLAGESRKTLGTMTVASPNYSMNDPVQHHERHDCRKEHGAEDAEHEQPVAARRRRLARRMALEQCEILRVRLPE